MPPFKRTVTPAFAGFTFARLASYQTSALPWGIGAAAAVSLFMSAVPLYKKDVLQKVPVIGSYFIDTTPASDKPF